MKILVACVAVLVAASTSGCITINRTEGGSASSTTPSGPPRATGDKPGVVAQVDCGVDGVSNVTTTYGVTQRHTLVGDNPLTQSAGGVKKYDNTYGSTADYPETTLSIVVEPTKGTCTSKLTDRESGSVLVEKSTAGKATLEALIPQPKS